MALLFQGSFMWWPLLHQPGAAGSAAAVCGCRTSTFEAFIDNVLHLLPELRHLA
jgi:hypothetical protein